jgi:hypothetical protein
MASVVAAMNMPMIPAIIHFAWIRIHQESHKVMPDETLGHIMQAYYGGSGLNMTFVEMAIVQFNKHAFVRGNPNFLYADKTLHLPSVNQIQALALGKKEKVQQGESYGERQNEIFFFGG